MAWVPSTVTMLVTTLVLLGACGEGKGTLTEVPTQPAVVMEVRGLVMEVQGESVTSLVSLTIRDEAGRLWTFDAEGFVGFTPSHLREHQALALPVTVQYRETADGLLALSVTD